LVLPSWTRDDLPRHRCDNRSHIHITLAEREALLRNKLVDLYCARCGYPSDICNCAHNRDRDIRIVRLRRIVALHGFSCRFGEFLAYIRGSELGRVMVSAIAMRPLESEGD